MAPGKTQVGADLGLHHLGNPSACTPNGQLQTMMEYHHPAPAQLIFHGSWKFVVWSHSQSLQLTGLGKYLPVFDLPTATKAQLQEEGVLSLYGGCTWNTQLR